jgi:hypothetical protein
VEQDPNHLKVSKTSTILYWIVRILCIERRRIIYSFEVWVENHGVEFLKMPD